MTPCALVGVDSGGTRTLVTVALERAGAEPKQETYEHDETLSGSMSPDRLPELVCHVLGEGELSANLRRVGWSAGVPIYMWIGAAGYTPWTRDNFKTAVNTIRDLLGHKDLKAIGAANDTSTILFGSDANGVIVAGTGSSVIIKSSDGRMHQAGGHEWVACDYGSGFWIGLNGIRTAFRDFEDKKNTPLLQRMRYAYGIRNTPKARADAELIEKVRELAIADDSMKREIAKFCEGVCSAAKAGNTDAQDIVKKAAEELANVTAKAIRRNHDLKNLPSGFTLAEVGSLWGNPQYRASFESQVEMRLESDEGGPPEIKWEHRPNGMDACITAAHHLSVKGHEIYHLPQDEFAPVITQF
jgi:N-acetylglucosamine kinase-like BadF-type ATPase